MSYAADTSVSVERSQAELRKILNKYGCTRFAIMDDDKKTTMLFEVNGRAIRFDLPLPQKSAFVTAKRYSRLVTLPPDKSYALWEQACRSKWRALLLCVKAKLEAVECGITSFEQEFLAHFVLPNGKTVGSFVIPQLDDVRNKGNMNLLLLGDK